MNLTCYVKFIMFCLTCAWLYTCETIFKNPLLIFHLKDEEKQTKLINLLILSFFFNFVGPTQQQLFHNNYYICTLTDQTQTLSGLISF